MSNQLLTFELVWHISSKALYLTWIYDNEKSHFHVKFTASKLSNYAILKTAENECEILQSRSSRLKGFCKKGVLKHFAKFRPHVCNFIKKETLAQVLSCEFCEVSKNTFCYRTPLMAASEWCLFLVQILKASKNLNLISHFHWSHFHRCYFLFPFFFPSFSVLFHFFLAAAHKKDSFKLRIHWNVSAHTDVIKIRSS